MSNIFFIGGGVLALFVMSLGHILLNRKFHWVLLCAPIYWFGWLLLSYSNTIGYYTLNWYTFLLVILFLTSFALSSFFGLNVSLRAKVSPRPHRYLLKRYFCGRVYQIHILIGVFLVLFLFSLIIPYGRELISGTISRNLVAGGGEDNYIVQGALKQFIYFRLIGAFFLYIILYYLGAMVFRFRTASLVLSLLLVILYSISSLSRSEVATYAMLILCFYLILMHPVGIFSFTNVLRKMGLKKCLFILVILLTATAIMVGISYNRVGGHSVGVAVKNLTDTISGYGVLGYASLAAEEMNEQSDFHNFRSYGSAFFGGLTKPFASILRRVGGEELYFTLQRYEITGPNRYAFNVVGYDGSRELKANVHYSSVYSHYIDAGILGVILFPSIWGFAMGFFYGVWFHYRNVFALLITVVLLFGVLKSCHVAQAHTEPLWFAFILYLFLYLKSSNPARKRSALKIS